MATADIRGGPSTQQPGLRGPRQGRTMTPCLSEGRPPPGRPGLGEGPASVGCWLRKGLLPGAPPRLSLGDGLTTHWWPQGARVSGTGVNRRRGCATHRARAVLRLDLGQRASTLRGTCAVGSPSGLSRCLSVPRTRAWLTEARSVGCLGARDLSASSARGSGWKRQGGEAVRPSGSDPAGLPTAARDAWTPTPPRPYQPRRGRVRCVSGTAPAPQWGLLLDSRWDRLPEASTPGWSPGSGNVLL